MKKVSILTNKPTTPSTFFCVVDPEGRTSMTKQYVIDLAFPVRDMEDWTHGTEVCENLASPGVCESSGTVFGLRDMQFHFESQAERDLAEVRLREQATHLHFDYISTYTCDEEGYQLDEYGNREV